MKTFVVGQFFFLIALIRTQPLDSSPSKAMCECVPQNQASQCLPYDSRLQATTLDEAMASFPDLSLDDDVPGQQSTATPVEDLSQCNTQECIDCRNDLQTKLKKIGLLPAGVNEVLATNISSTCSRYRFSRHDEGVYEKNDQVQEEDSHENSSDEDDSDDDDRKERDNKERKHRFSRQVTPTPTTIIGNRFTISCTSKGVTSDTTGLVSLCSSCWVWRKLPDNYSPLYINELICDTADDACLSGYAACGVGHRSVEVVRNDSGVLTHVSLTAGTYCECKIATGSALQPLVSGGGLNIPLPATSLHTDSNTIAV